VDQDAPDLVGARHVAVCALGCLLDALDVVEADVCIVLLVSVEGMRRDQGGEGEG
jgi:hypothetical protein